MHIVAYRRGREWNLPEYEEAYFTMLTQNLNKAAQEKSAVEEFGWTAG
jgi:hypothetical protein